MFFCHLFPKITLLLLFERSCCLNLPIGGIFEDQSLEEEELTFKAVIDLINEQNSQSSFRFEAITTNIAPEDVIEPRYNKTIGVNWDNPYRALNAACSILNKGIVGIVSPSYDNNADIIQSLCDTQELPFIQVAGDRVHGHECCSMNIFPHIPVLSQAVADLVMHMNWKNFTILYESFDSLANIAQLLKLYNKTGNSVTLYQLERTDDLGYRESFMKVRSTGQTNFVLHCDILNLFEILQHAQQVGLIMKKYSYAIINLDMHTIDFELFQHSKANITGFRLVDPEHPKTRELARYMIKKKLELGKISTTDSTKAAWNLSTISALIADAVTLLSKTLADIENLRVKPLFCNLSESWEHGSTIYNYMKMKSFDGLTGLVHFDHSGLRSDFKLDVIELRDRGFTKIGHWNSTSELTISRPPLDEKKKNLADIFLTVLICWSEPYALYKNESRVLQGNDQYEGFVIDIIHEIALLEGFKYKFKRNVDDRNGDFDPITKKWTGMIGDILYGKGDIAIGDLAITQLRKEYVDFTTPFITSGTQIMMNKPSQEIPNFFSFADPFHKEVWVLIGLSYFGMSIMLYIISHISPPEWENENPCIENPPFLINQFNFRDSLWYMLGCLMQQGAADLAPRAPATRLLSGVWGFFILIMVSYYKAQLAAFLTTEIKDLPFHNVEELVRSAGRLGIRYGAVSNETTHIFFKNSPSELHQEIAHYMETHPEDMVDENYEGYLKVEAGNYAFFTDSVFAEFVTKVVCTMTTVGNPINQQDFAVAMRKHSPYRGIFSSAILKLKESGRIAELQKKWWDDKFKIEECENYGAQSAIAPPLNLMNVVGIFGLTMGIIALSCCLVFLELAIDTYLKSYRKNRTFMKDFKAELKNNLKFNEVKTVRSQSTIGDNLLNLT